MKLTIEYVVQIEEKYSSEKKKKSFYFLVDVRSNDSDSIPNLDKIAARLRGSVGNYTP